MNHEGKFWLAFWGMVMLTFLLFFNMITSCQERKYEAMEKCKGDFQCLNAMKNP